MSAAPSSAQAPRALLFGATGQIGERVLARLREGGWAVLAVSRRPRPAQPGLAWRQADLRTLADLGDEAFSVIVSCGPLDQFARWYEHAAPVAGRVVAFGSTSLQVKRESRELQERGLSRRLAEAERTLFEAARRQSAVATVLRPTLVYGAGRDLTLSRIAALAARSGHFALPADATGRRQPVHVDDLAAAALAVLKAPATAGRSYALGGGEVLTYLEMVRRVLQASPRPARLWRVPPALFAAAVRTAQALGRLHGLGPAALQRMREDLVFELEPARRDFGYAPRPFKPRAAEPGLAPDRR